MVVLVDVGRWRLTSDQSTVGIVKIVYGSIFLYSYIDPINSSHLSCQLNKEEFDLCTCNISWFLCPVFYSSSGSSNYNFKFKISNGIKLSNIISMIYGGRSLQAMCLALSDPPFVLLSAAAFCPRNALRIPPKSPS
jgi:hypothetical protein